MLKTPISIRLTTLSLALAGALASTGCSSVGDVLSGDKVDYRTGGVKTVNLAVPPDLSQLSGQARYTPGQSSTVSANSMSPSNNAATGAKATATEPSGAIKLERNGQTRWLSVAMPPEKTWEQVKAFWLEAGFELAVDQPDTGIMETTWSENRAKLPQTGVRKLLGSVLDSLYDTGERDQYRTRIERTAKGSEIYISHRGVQEVYENEQRKEQTKWVGRPSDPTLEAEMLSRLMLKLGAPKDAAAAVKSDASTGSAAAVAAPARARLLPDGISLSTVDDQETTWRRVGLALDRSGFTIEDRDRSQGIYEIRLVLAGNTPGASKPGFFAKLFGASEASADGLARYRIQVTAAGNSSAIRVLDAKGQAESSDAARSVAKQLLDELS